MLPALRALTDEDRRLEQPPEAIWDQIQREVALDEDELPQAEGATLAPAAHAQRRRPHRRTVVLAIAAVVLVALGIGAVVLVDQSDDEVVARTQLDTLDTGESVGSATLTTGNTLTLEVEAPPVESLDDEFLELWLINDDVTGLVSLGPVTSGRQEVVLPPGLNVADFPIVDVSVERFDGDPSHSGDSIARGRLDV